MVCGSVECLLCQNFGNYNDDNLLDSNHKGKRWTSNNYFYTGLGHTDNFGCHHCKMDQLGGLQETHTCNVEIVLCHYWRELTRIFSKSQNELFLLVSWSHEKMEKEGLVRIREQGIRGQSRFCFAAPPFDVCYLAHQVRVSGCLEVRFYDDLCQRDVMTWWPRKRIRLKANVRT